MGVDPKGSFAITAWPFPEEVEEDERDFRDWVSVAHPESEARMFGSDAHGVFRFTEEALQLHADYLDEYLIYLGG